MSDDVLTIKIRNVSYSIEMEGSVLKFMQGIAHDIEDSVVDCDGNPEISNDEIIICAALNVIYDSYVQHEQDIQALKERYKKDLQEILNGIEQI